MSQLLCASTAIRPCDEVRDDLVAKEVKVDPAIARAADAASEEARVEAASCGQVVDRKRVMERL